MPDQHVVIGEIRSLTMDPQALSDRGHTVPMTVEFSDGQTARLSPADPGYEWRQAVLSDFYDAGLPVYAILSEAGGVIETLWMPLPGVVTDLSRDESGDVTFHLNSSAAAFVVKAAAPKYQQFLELLQAAQLDRIPLLVTEDEEGGELIDIRPDPNPFAPAGRKAALHAPAVAEAAGTVTPGQADELFQLISAASCDPARPERGCIPYLYPDNGCHTRAHRACAILSAQAGSVRLQKIWNYPSSPFTDLVFQTRYAPHCAVRWSFHVAVELTVSGGRSLVLDPALFPDGPVSAKSWRSVQGDPASRLARTSPDQYLPPNFDTRNVNPDRDLVYWTGRLRARAGRIPFSHCPA